MIFFCSVRSIFDTHTRSIFSYFRRICNIISFSRFSLCYFFVRSRMRDALTHSERERANEIGSFCLAKTNVYARARVALDSIYTKLFALVFRFPFGSVFFSLKFHRRHIMCSKIWYRITDFYVHGLSVLFHSCYVFQLVIFPIFSIFFHSFFAILPLNYQCINQVHYFVVVGLVGNSQINFIKMTFFHFSLSSNKK